MVPVPCRSLEQLQDFINAEMLRWGKVVQPMTLGKMRENGHTPSLGATAQHEIT